MSKSKKVSNNIYSLPIIPVLQTWGEWGAYMSDEADPSFSFKLRPVQLTTRGDGGVSVKKEMRVKEAFPMRERFFAIQTAQDALAFFQEYGPFQVDKYLGTQVKPVTLAQTLRRRNFYLHALTERSIDNLARTYSGDELREGMENWYLWSPLPMELVFRQPMAALVRSKDVEDALRATVFLDRLRGLPWQRCIREDCGRPFEVKGARARLYCSPECAHLQSVRNYNKRKLAAKAAKPAKHATKKGKR